MSESARCPDINARGIQCDMWAGHTGAHGASETRPRGGPTSFARVMLTPIIVMISSWLIGTFLLMRVEGGQLLAMAIGAAISIAYIVVASRR